MHKHEHSHHHHRGTDASSNRIVWAFFLNAGFALIEFIGGWLTNSTAIMADAVHDLGDSLSIGSAWLLEKMGRKSANTEFTYGYRRLSLFGALSNGLILIAGSLWIVNASVQRLFDPQMPVTEGMFLLALLGVSVNGYAAYRLRHGTTRNEKMLNWHLLEDVLGWVAVLITAVVLHFFHWPILDPLLSLVFTAFILINVVRNIWLTGKLFIQAVPDKQLVVNIKATLLQVPDLCEVHHLHLWSLDGEHHVLTAHVVMSEHFNLADYNATKTQLKAVLEPYSLAHTTIEIEVSSETCRDTN